MQDFVSLSILLHDHLCLENATTFGQGKVSKKFITDRSKAIVLLWFIFSRVIFINVDCCMTL